MFPQHTLRYQLNEQVEGCVLHLLLLAMLHNYVGIDSRNCLLQNLPRAAQLGRAWMLLHPALKSLHGMHSPLCSAQQPLCSTHAHPPSFQHTFTSHDLHSVQCCNNKGLIHCHPFRLLLTSIIWFGRSTNTFILAWRFTTSYLCMDFTSVSLGVIQMSAVCQLLWSTKTCVCVNVHKISPQNWCQCVNTILDGLNLE